MRKASDKISPAGLDRSLLSAQRVMAVSPHLDDAILSAGETLRKLANHGAQITVLTFFAGNAPSTLSDFAQEFHDECHLGTDAVAVRRAEDVQAVHHLGGRTIHGDLLDVIYRRTRAGAWVCSKEEDVFAPRLDDSTKVADLVRVLQDAVVQTDPDLILGPAGLGGHVDHLLTRDAVRLLPGQVPSALWADFPYSRRIRRPELTPFRILSNEPSSQKVKLAAAEFYSSQLPMLWPDGSWRRALSTHQESFVELHRDHTGDGYPPVEFSPVTR